MSWWMAAVQAHKRPDWPSKTGVQWESGVHRLSLSGGIVCSPWSNASLVEGWREGRTRHVWVLPPPTPIHVHLHAHPAFSSYIALTTT